MFKSILDRNHTNASYAKKHFCAIMFCKVTTLKILEWIIYQFHDKLFHHHRFLEVLVKSHLGKNYMKCSIFYLLTVKTHLRQDLTGVLAKGNMSERNCFAFLHNLQSYINLSKWNVFGTGFSGYDSKQTERFVPIKRKSELMHTWSSSREMIKSGKILVILKYNISTKQSIVYSFPFLYKLCIFSFCLFTNMRMFQIISF